MSNGQDPRVTDLRRYKRARERARRQPPPRPQQQGSQGFLGPRKNAGLILAIVVAVLAALWLLPLFL